MGGEWTTFRLGEVCPKIGSGATPRGGAGVYLERGEVALIRSQNVYNDGFRHGGLVYLTTEHASELAHVDVEASDVLLNITGDSVARACQIDTAVLPARVNQHVAIIRPDRNVLWPRLLRFILVSPGMQKQLLAMASAGATRNALTKRMIEALEVTAPADVSEQRRIAEILGALDDKIDLNRRMSETLEAMARSLFKSWFVDFDPVRAKAERRDSGLPQVVADLFPAAWESSPLGLIPAGWRVVPLRESTSYLSRGIGPTYLDSGGICVVNQKCIRDGRVDFAQAKRHDPAKRSVEGRQLHCLDVLVNSTGMGTLGRVAQLRRIPEAAIVDSHVTVLRSAHDVDGHYFGWAVRTRETEIEALGEGSTGQTELSRERLGSMPFLKPTSAVQEAFGGAVEPLVAQVSAKERESETLAALRDTLLPKLISGELRIPDAERIVGEVA